ncbi:ATP-dependent helicase HrpB [Salmonella enterica subsp. arizonae]|uniref:ATP-dependent helicase HrpB n=1 Tax=Salmonella enterica subsp. arizonae TaxID=59203 RepID=A0A2X4TIT8_SALER|nr:ATP-dependent helicase HrpB [Salmonella enterica subsp. arizonae]
MTGPVDEASLLATLERWLLPHMTGVQSLRGLKSLNVNQAFTGTCLTIPCCNVWIVSCLGITLCRREAE